MLRILIDDLRSFTDGRECEVARTSQQGVWLLRACNMDHIDELWLDHDLGGDDTAMPIISEIEYAYYDEHFPGAPYDIGTIYVHSTNPVGAERMRLALENIGYHVVQVDAIKQHLQMFGELI